MGRLFASVVVAIGVIVAEGPARATEQLSSSPAAASCAPSAATEVIAVQFGAFGADENARLILIETNTIPVVPGTPFGWLVLFKTDKPTVVWREEFELPVAPPTWGPGELIGAFTVSPDRKTAVTERTIPTALGFFANMWRYAPGDPVGAHKMRIYIDGVLVREFEFSLVAADSQEEPGASSKHNREVNI